METATCSMGELLASLCGGALEGGDRLCRQPALRVLPGTPPSVPAATGTIPPDGCVLGIDVGSTSTDLVLTGRDGTLIDYQYLRTAGDRRGRCAGAWMSSMNALGRCPSWQWASPAPAGSALAASSGRRRAG